MTTTVADKQLYGCPDCGCLNCTTTRTTRCELPWGETRLLMVIRERTCRKCGKRFRTREVPID